MPFRDDSAGPYYDRVALEQEWRRKIARNGELFSDTGKPSIFGSALATGGEDYDLPDWLRF